MKSNLKPSYPAVPKVADLAVIAYTDEVLSERACAIVVPRPGETASLAETAEMVDMAEYLRGLSIAIFKGPEQPERGDAAARHSLGRNLKRGIREELRHA
jgi:non-ribosomal peptide synthetase component E (peptide arylation enzyme)